MAGVKRCLGLDLGSHTVKLAEMAIDKGGVRIIRMISAPVPVGPDAAEEERSAAIISTVRGLLKQNKITTKKAVFSMPGQTVFVRRVRLPRAPGPRLTQIVHFEARQLIPFPLEKTMVQYQVFDSGEEREVEVLLVAMKKETNQEFMRLVRRIGLNPIGITVSPLGLFNGQELFRFNAKSWQEQKAGSGGLLGKFSLGGGKKAKAAKPKKEKKAKKGKRKKGAEPEEPAVSLTEDLATFPKEGGEEEIEIAPGAAFEEVRAYVNIGARSTDLAICKSGGSKTAGFTRSIPLGGNQITGAILKACKCEAFAQAEAIKTTNTAVLSGTFEFEADRAGFDQHACAAATAVCDRLIAEVRRSLDYFISQPDGIAVDLVVLSGGSASLPYLPSYIEERLGLPVEVSTGLNNSQIKTPSQFGEDFDYSPFKIAVGLATQGLGISPIEIDFLPTDIRSMRDFSAQYAELVALGGFIAVMLFFSTQLGSANREEYTKRTFICQDYIQRQEPLQKALAKAKEERDKVQGKLAKISSQLPQRDFWLQFLLLVHQAKPAGVLVTGILCEADYMDPKQGTVKMMVEAEQAAAVTGFVGALNLMRDFVKKDPDLNPLGKSKSEHFQRDVVKFVITITVQNKDEKNVLTHLGEKPAIEPPLMPTPPDFTQYHPVWLQGIAAPLTPEGAAGGAYPGGPGAYPGGYYPGYYPVGPEGYRR